MSGENNADNGTEKNLMTLDQLRQTIEAMTGVVNRLKRHLNKQLLHNPALSHDEADQTIELSRELLINERELQELQELADQQRQAVPIDEESSVQHIHDGQSAPARREGFIVEISRLDEAPDSGQDRTLH